MCFRNCDLHVKVVPEAGMTREYPRPIRVPARAGLLLNFARPFLHIGIPHGYIGVKGRVLEILVHTGHKGCFVYNLFSFDRIRDPGGKRDPEKRVKRGMVHRVAEGITGIGRPSTGSIRNGPERTLQTARVCPKSSSWGLLIRSRFRRRRTCPPLPASS